MHSNVEVESHFSSYLQMGSCSNMYPIPVFSLFQRIFQRDSYFAGMLEVKCCDLLR